MANKKYKLANSDYWETSGVYDLTEGKTQRAINAEVKGSINVVNNQITPYRETSYTASRAYKMGDFIEINNIVYRVKTAIASGATLTNNTNIVQDNIGANLPSLSPDASLTLNTDNTNGGDLHARIYGNFMYISGYVNCNGSIAGSNAVLGTFPSDYKPSGDINFLAFANYNNTGLQPRMMRYKASGELVTQVGSGTLSGQIFFMCSLIPYTK